MDTPVARVRTCQSALVGPLKNRKERQTRREKSEGGESLDGWRERNQRKAVLIVPIRSSFDFQHLQDRPSTMAAEEGGAVDAGVLIARVDNRTSRH